MISAFGVDHGYEVSKADEPKKPKKTSKGRLAAGGFFPGAHAAVVGRPGYKLQAAGHELGGGLVGGTVLPLVGGPAGGAAGTSVANRKGYYYPQKKKKK